jgi:hypothetical protein
MLNRFLLQQVRKSSNKNVWSYALLFFICSFVACSLGALKWTFISHVSALLLVHIFTILLEIHARSNPLPIIFKHWINMKYSVMAILNAGSRSNVGMITVIRSSFSRDDVKLTRMGALWPVEPFLAFLESRDTSVALFWPIDFWLIFRRISGWDYRKFGAEM